MFSRIVFSSKNFHYFATSPSPALGRYGSIRKWPANTVQDCILALSLEDLCSYMKAKDGSQWIGKIHNLSCTFCTYVSVPSGALSYGWSESECREPATWVYQVTLCPQVKLNLREENLCAGCIVLGLSWILCERTCFLIVSSSALSSGWIEPEFREPATLLT